MNKTSYISHLTVHRLYFTILSSFLFLFTKLAYFQQFVTHPSCQQVLRSMWVETLGSWYSWPFKWRALHVAKHALLTPVVAIGFIFIPRADVLGPLRVPLHRFIYSATSYLVFLCLLLVTLLNDRR